MNSPCAMLMTPIWPKVSDRPSAASSSTDPSDSPAKSWPNNASMRVSFRGGAARGRRPARGSARQALGPVVVLQERVGLDRLAAAPLGVDQPVLPDLVDQRGLG